MEAIQNLTGPGGDSELREEKVLGARLPVFANRARDLGEVLARSASFDDSDYIVTASGRPRHDPLSGTGTRLEPERVLASGVRSELRPEASMNADLSPAGRTAIVTGAGAGLGRAEALALAAQGASVVVNDTGPGADEVAAEIAKAGGQAVAVRGDVGDWSMGDTLVSAALDTFGSLDVLVNNAGVLRDTMLFNLSEPDWDDVVQVHLKGHAAVSRAAAVHWRAASKAAVGPVYGRVINTASEAFLFGPAGQPNYSAAKAGIVALTLSTAAGLGRYGVRANAICPRARTAMTEGTFAAGPAPGGLDVMAPERVGTFVGYLASPASERISGQVFVVYGDMVALLAPPTVEQKFTAENGVFSVEELGERLTPYFEGRDPRRTYAAYSVAALDNTGTGRGGAR